MTSDLAFATWLAAHITIFNGPPPNCGGDIDSNGQVGLSDVLSIPSEWGCTDRNRSVDRNNATGLEDGIPVLAV